MPLDPAPVPNELKGLRLALLVAGGIAAYKIVDLASALTQAGAQVRVAMTASATRFVGAPSFQGVTGNPVLTGLWSADGSPEPHVTLGDWAQLILLAPATANIIGRVASGRSDDIVTATLLASRCPIVVESRRAGEHRSFAAPGRGRRGAGVWSSRQRSCGRRPACECFGVDEGDGGCGSLYLRPGRAAGGGDRGRHEGAARPRSVHQQLLQREDGVRRRGRSCGPRRTRDTGDHRRASGT